MAPNKQTELAGPGPLKAAAKLAAVTEGYNRELFAPKERRKPLVWVTSMAPVEIFKAFDMVIAMPENYAALCASRKMAGEFCDISEKWGYSGDICAYILCSFGSELADKGPYDGESLPDPDLLVCEDYACNTHVKWWQNLSEYYNVPLFMVDGAYGVEQPLREHHKEYLVSELRELVSFLEKHTGKKLDMNRLKNIVALSDKTCELWLEIRECQKAIPSPIGALDIFTLMLTLVLMRGTGEAVDFYQEVLDEVKERVKNKVGAVGNERFRLAWDMFPVWHRLKLIKLFEDAGAVVITDLYSDAFGGRLNPDDPFGSLAERYLNYFARTTSGGHANIYKQRIKDWHVDGMVFHCNRCCRYLTCQQLTIMHILENELNLPNMSFEGSMADPRIFSEAQVLTRIQAFLEMLEARKYGTSGKR